MLVPMYPDFRSQPPMTYFTDVPQLPTIDLSLFEIGNPWRDHVAAQIDWAAAEFGIFRIVNHGVEVALADSLVMLSRRFFLREPVLRAGQGTVTPAGADPGSEIRLEGAFIRDAALVPPSLTAADLQLFLQLPGFSDLVRDYMTATTGLAHRLMTSFARGLHLGDNYFIDRFTGGAASQLRIVRRASAVQAVSTRAGRTGEVTGQALLTLIAHDELSSLQVEHHGRTIEVAHVPGALICSVGEPLARLTGGRYMAGPYRVVPSCDGDSLVMSLHFGSGAADPRPAGHPEPIVPAEHWNPPSVPHATGRAA